jgi:FAD/FMN-containing dehydrogenase
MIVSRRDFLASGARAALAGAAGLELLSAIGCSTTNSTGGVVPSNMWAQLARQLKGALLRPGDPGFAAYASPNNLRYASVLPAGIAVCANAQDVSASIRWAREFGVPLVARSGGHSYGGYSTTTGLMIDVARMNTIVYDASTGIATMGGGTRNGDVFRALRGPKRAVTHGRCFSVGVAGLVLGGGIGFNMRPNGITCDLLTGTEIVTADGQIRQLSDKQNSDLFWAVRGAGGGNFGIHTSFTFRTFAVGQIVVYDLEWKRQPDEVFAALLSALGTAPNTFGAKVSVVAPTAAERADGRDIRIQLLGQFEGTRAQFDEILAPVTRIAEPTGPIHELPYWPGQDLISEAGLPEFFHESSRFFNAAISDAAIAVILDGMRRWPGTTKAASFKLFQTGGVMNQVAPGAMAFVHRSSTWLSSIGLVWEHEDSEAAIKRNLAWQTALYDTYIPFATGGAYQNFIDPTLADWKTAYYGTNLERLERVKAQVDPQHVFRFAEAIP